MGHACSSLLPRLDRDRYLRTSRFARLPDEKPAARPRLDRGSLLWTGGATGPSRLLFAFGVAAGTVDVSAGVGGLAGALSGGRGVVAARRCATGAQHEPGADHRSAHGRVVGPVMSSEAGKAGPPPARGQDEETYTDAWKRFLTLERQVLDADTACREDVYTQGISEVGAVVAEFEADHAAEIQQAQHGWSEIVDGAAELGYRGQVGPLGQ